MARRANVSGWWQRDSDWLPPQFDTYLGLETAAEQIRGYEQRAVPELLQTADYARALLGLVYPAESADSIERRVALRMERREILTRRHPTSFWVIVEDAALRRPIGGSTVWRAQLDYLQRALEATHIRMQVLPEHVSGQALTDGSFTILRFADRELPEIVYVQQLTGALYLEDRTELDAYRTMADRLSVHAAPPELTPQMLTALRDSRPPTLDEPAAGADE